jgi:transcriptional regulator with XRE-family HTH domain
MNPEKVGQFIKKLRKDNNLTQKELADKYGVTYQAVSKWENGINLPDVSLIREMSKDFNISVEDILDGEIKNNKVKHNNIILYVVSFVLLFIIVLFIIHLIHDNNSSTYNFKTFSSTCNEFKVSGSIAYDNNKSSIYISGIDYCGGDDTTEYKEIQCNLYENHDNSNIIISSCKRDQGKIKLEEYLKDVELNIDNYKQACSKYNDDSLFLEINATREDNKVITYKIPLSLNDNCKK